VRRKASDADKTPNLKRQRTFMICPHCRKSVEVMPSGLFALHPVQGKWARSMCAPAPHRAASYLERTMLIRLAPLTPGYDVIPVAILA
jgi:hypothetical protein